MMREQQIKGMYGDFTGHCLMSDFKQKGEVKGKKKYMKFLLGFMASITLLSNTGLPLIQASSIQKEAEDTISLSELIEIVEPYVAVNENGFITFKNIPIDIYEKYDLSKLQIHFDKLNTLKLKGDISINEDLSIEDHTTNSRAVYGKWTYHWWGYDRKFSNTQTTSYINQLNTAAAGAVIVGSVTGAFPPISGIANFQAGYWALLAARVAANNKGKGVYVGVTYALVFDVEPL